MEDDIDIIEIKYDFWSLLNDFQKEDIEIGLSDLEAGNKKIFDEFMKKYQ